MCLFIISFSLGRKPPVSIISFIIIDYLFFLKKNHKINISLILISILTIGFLYHFVNYVSLNKLHTSRLNISAGPDFTKVNVWHFSSKVICLFSMKKVLLELKEIIGREL